MREPIWSALVFLYKAVINYNNVTLSPFLFTHIAWL